MTAALIRFGVAAWLLYTSSNVTVTLDRSVMLWNSPNVMVLSASEMTAVIVASPSAAVTETKGWETSEGHFSSSSEHEAIRNAPDVYKRQAQIYQGL